MKYPYLITKKESDLEKDDIEVIDDYWAFDKGSFLNTPTKIRTRIKISQPKLNSIVQNNSNTILYLVSARKLPFF